LTRLKLTASTLALALSSCLLEPFTGSDVILEFGTGTFNSGDVVNRSTQHYELFATLNDGVVSVGKFTIDERLDAFEVPSGERIGAASHQGSSLPVSGIEFHTEVQLQDAEQILVSIEDNGDTDYSPNGPIVGRATLEVGDDGHPRGVLVGDVPTLAGSRAPLVESQVTILVSE
jgi:hypothetical protein